MTPDQPFEPPNQPEMQAAWDRLHGAGFVNPPDQPSDLLSREGVEKRAAGLLRKRKLGSLYLDDVRALRDTAFHYLACVEESKRERADAVQTAARAMERSDSLERDLDSARTREAKLREALERISGDALYLGDAEKIAREALASSSTERLCWCGDPCGHADDHLLASSSAEGAGK
jgi:hypothetical protein